MRRSSPGSCGSEEFPVRSLPRSRAAWGRATAVALLGAAAVGLADPGTPAVSAAAAPGQPVADDYGQSAVEVAAEVKAAVDADPAVSTARRRVAYLKTVLATRVTAQAKARTAYLAAVRSGVRSRIASTYSAYVSAKAATARARTAYNTAATSCASTVSTVTARVRATHYLPVDGTWTGDLKRYLVPTVPFSFEPMQVQITVYGGHVSDVAVVAQAAAGSDSDSYNQMSLSTLVLEAAHAGDTAEVAAVSGATLTSEAFRASLTSALVAAGFHA